MQLDQSELVFSLEKRPVYACSFVKDARVFSDLPASHPYVKQSGVDPLSLPRSG